ncbi:MAG: hypothetical protein AAF664_13875 [Planctomycetota bacterium]
MQLTRIALNAWGIPAGSHHHEAEISMHLDRWIGGIFALGSSLFVLASVLSLLPELAARWSMGTIAINAIYFAGSIPFSVAAYLQLFQSANQDSIEDPIDGKQRQDLILIGWKPGDSTWLSCFLQFLGTLFFNMNTFDAMMPTLTWFQYDVAVWAPNIIGSILFITSGYVAFTDTCRRSGYWQPAKLFWWVAFINLLGCIAFLASSLFSIILPGLPESGMALTAVAFTLSGACCFLTASWLMTIPSKHAPNSQPSAGHL